MSVSKFVLLSCCVAFVCKAGVVTARAETSGAAQVQVGDLAQTVQSKKAEKAAGTPTDGEEPPATSLSEEDEAMKPRAGNLFHVQPGHTPTYWEGLEGHVTIEAGISGNPWTRSGRNFAQYYSDRANTVTLNQIIGSLSHPVTSVGSGYGIGFVLEAMYGSDARFDPTIGMGPVLYTVCISGHLRRHIWMCIFRGYSNAALMCRLARCTALWEPRARPHLRGLFIHITMHQTI